MLTDTRGGARETEVKELAVMPRISWLPAIVSTTTGEAMRRMMDRKLLPSIVTLPI